MRRLILLYGLHALVVIVCAGCRNNTSTPQHRESSAPKIIKQPVQFATRTFDPANPPADMPPLPSGGDIAECDSNFISNASVGGQAWHSDATHATVTFNLITVTLQLNITIWVPAGVSDRVMEHEQGHRQISEYYYRTADKLAEKIASNYMGKQVAISGPDLDAELHKTLQGIGAEITAEYNKELDPNPTQLLYDSITDHSRNEVAVQDAVAHALKNVAVEAGQPANADPPDHQ